MRCRCLNSEEPALVVNQTVKNLETIQRHMKMVQPGDWIKVRLNIRGTEILSSGKVTRVGGGSQQALTLGTSVLFSPYGVLPNSVMEIIDHMPLAPPKLAEPSKQGSVVAGYLHPLGTAFHHNPQLHFVRIRPSSSTQRNVWYGVDDGRLFDWGTISNPMEVPDDQL